MPGLPLPTVRMVRAHPSYGVRFILKRSPNSSTSAIISQSTVVNRGDYTHNPGFGP